MHYVHPRTQGLDLNLLALLAAVSEHGQVTVAAQKVGLSQSAASHALTRLRQAVNDPLFVRGSEGLEFTPKAEALIRVMSGTLTSLERALEETSTFDPQVSQRTFSVAAEDAFDIVLLPKLRELLRERAPRVNLSVLRPRQRDIARELERAEIDLYYGVLPNRPQFAGLLPDPGFRDLETAKILDESWVGLVRRGHPTIRRAPTLERYAAVGHILFSPTGSGPGVVDRMLEDHGLSRRVALRVSSFHAAIDCVRHSDFVWTAPRRVVGCLDPKRQLTQFRVPLPLPDYGSQMVWHTRFTADPGHKWFRRQVMEAAKAASRSK